MTDRQPIEVLANGAIRYGVYNSDGTLNRYEYIKNEDGATTEGTALNKANLLSDATCTALGIPTTSVPDDALSRLSFVVAPLLEDATPAEINHFAYTDLVERIWSIGDTTAPIPLSDGQSIVLQIAGFKHDDLVSGGKAGITFIMKNCYQYQKRFHDSNSNYGGWNGSELRTHMDTYLSLFPAEWQAIIKQVIKKTTRGGKATTIYTTNDYLWCPSYKELNFPKDVSLSADGEGEAYPLFVGNGSRLKTVCEAKERWWTRTSNMATTTDYMLVGYEGIAQRDVASYSIGIAVGLCV